jgi:hypothetical protein
MMENITTYVYSDIVLSSTKLMTMVLENKLIAVARGTSYMEKCNFISGRKTTFKLQWLPIG